MKERVVRYLFALLSLILPLTVYFLTLSDGVAAGDSTEMVTAAYVLGIPHQPGYPVNTLIGNLFTKLPINKPAVWKINFASAVIDSLAVFVFYFLVKELLKKDKNEIKTSLVAFSSSMFLAFNYIFWQYSTKFEVFPLNNLFTVSLIFIALKLKTKWDKDKQEQKQGMKIELLLIIFSFILGLAFTHHQTIVLIFPAIIYIFAGNIIDLVKDIWDKFEEKTSKPVKKVLPKKDPLKPLKNIDYKTGKKNYKTEIVFSVYAISFIAGMLPFLVIYKFAQGNPPLNWGDIKDFGGVISALMRTDFGTFSSYLVGFEAVEKNYPIDQLFYYLQNVLYDFSIIGAVVLIFGTYYLWKKNKKVLGFIAVGWFVSGIVFLSYAGFPLQDSFNQATVHRFYMMPNVFVAIAISYGIYYLFEFLENQAKKGGKFDKNGLVLGKAIITMSFIFPLAFNFSKASLKGSSLTQDYAIDAFSKTEDNALILLSGDIPNMAADYYRYVEAGGNDHRVTFTPGQFHLSWFIPQLMQRYPDIVIPKPMAGKMFTTTTQVIDANYGKRPIYVEPGLVTKDEDIEKNYTLWPKNLLFLVKKKGEDMNLESFREEGDELWKNIDLDLIQKTMRKSPSFEESVVFYYARHFYNLGYVYEEVKLYDDAIREYKRVLQIDPYFKEALSSLGRIYGYSLENPDYYTAIDYLKKFQSVLKKDERDLGVEAQGMIEELTQKAQEEAQEQIQEENDTSSTDSAQTNQ